jgi:hypothetical protein
VAVSALSKSSFGTFDKFQRSSVGNTPATGVFVMGGHPNSAVNYATSTDGQTWTLRSLGTNFGGSTGVTKIGSTYVSVRSNGTLGVTTDPVAGTARNAGNFAELGTSNTFLNGTYINNQWVWWGDYGWCMNGFRGPVAGGTNTTGVAFGNNTWVIVRNGQIFSQNTELAFPATATYTSRTSAVSSPNSINFVNNLFICGGSNGLATSPDGITWTARASAGAVNFTASKFFFQNGLYFAAPTTGSGNLLTSPDGITWTSRSPVISSAVFIACAYGAGVWVVMEANGNLWSSPDGTTWTSRTNPMAGNNWASANSGLSTIFFG